MCERNKRFIKHHTHAAGTSVSDDLLQQARGFLPANEIRRFNKGGSVNERRLGTKPLIVYSSGSDIVSSSMDQWKIPDTIPTAEAPAHFDTEQASREMDSLQRRLRS